MRYEDSMRGIADRIIREQQHETKQKEKEHIYWYDEYATLNFFIHICRCIGNVKGSGLSDMVARLKELNANYAKTERLFRMSGTAIPFSTVRSTAIF